MDTNTSSLEVFKHGTTRLLASLTDEVDHDTADINIRYALFAVGTDAEKLKILVNIIYGMPTSRGDCSASLLVKLLDDTPNNISAVIVKSTGEVVHKGKHLARHYMLNKCQTDFEPSVTYTVWSTEPFTVAAALYQTDCFCLTSNVIVHVMATMAVSEYLFLPQNLEQFARSCTTCGSRLERNIKGGHVDISLNKASARASSESIGCQPIS